MNHVKLIVLGFTLLLFFLISKNCPRKEGLTNIFQDNPALRCEDDPTWTLGDGITCADIGTRASCYSFDEKQRDGWESCRKACGNCAYTRVNKTPMKVVPGFSGDPIEDFGVVLNIDKSREFVKQGADTIPHPIAEMDDMGEDIDNMDERVDSLEDLFNIVTQGLRGCVKGHKVSKATILGVRGFLNCNNSESPCPPPTEKITKKRLYVETDCPTDRENKDKCPVKFPAKSISCKDVDDDKSTDGIKSKCDAYVLMGLPDSLDNDSDKDKKTKPGDKHKKRTLYDFCPHECSGKDDICPRT